MAIVKGEVNVTENIVLETKELDIILISEKYNFYADPFFSTDEMSIRLEGLNRRTGLGEILEIDVNDLNKQKVICEGGHHSYPISFFFEQNEYLMPEVASHSAQFVKRINDDTHSRFYLRGLEELKILDATLFEKQGSYYLFFGLAHDGNEVLHLWVAESPFHKFVPHPSTPISISSCNSRMGGGIEKLGGRLMRFGQDNSGGYGEALTVMEVTSLSPSSFHEIEVGKIRVDGFKGPHTISFSKDRKNVLIDFYREEFSIFAGLRRAIALISNVSWRNS